MLDPVAVIIVLMICNTLVLLVSVAMIEVLFEHQGGKTAIYFGLSIFCSSGISSWFFAECGGASGIFYLSSAAYHLYFILKECRGPLVTMVKLYTVLGFVGSMAAYFYIIVEVILQYDNGIQVR